MACVSRTSALSFALALLACGGRASDEDESTGFPFPSTSAEADGSGGETSSSSSGGADSSGDRLDAGVESGASTASSSGGDPGGDCPCENVMDGIYVLNSNAPPSIWFYDPQANQFSQLGNLSCPTGLTTVANSMAIDRHGNAYLNYYTTASLAPNTSDWRGQLFRVPLVDLTTCEDLGYDALGSWFLLGMGYSVIGPGTSCDKLYLYNSDKYPQYPNFTSQASQLARWNEVNVAVEPIGPTNYPVAELTGTGDGRLYAFATVAANRSALVQFDKANGGEIENIPLDGLDITNAFAFAFWGGDVYFFTEVSAGTTNSKVTRLDYDMNTGGGLAVVNPSTGLHITGAGVSTCASVQPPIG